MREEKLLDALANVSEEFILESAPKTGRTRYGKRRIAVVGIAACLAFSLLGAGFAAVVRGDSIQSWFGHFWERSTGMSMGEGQSDLVERLSQDVGASEEADGLKVTVDSATVGGDCFFLLLRVEGTGLSPSGSYGFDDVHLTVDPDPVAEGHPSSMSGYGCDFLGVDGDGAALVLLDYHAITADAAFAPGETFDVSLVLSDFCENPLLAERAKLLTEGEWSFDFSLMRNEALDSVALSDAEVMAMDMGPNAENAGLSSKRTEAALTSIELSSTGLTFTFHHESGRLALDPRIEAVLDDGRTVGVAGGGGVSLEDGTLWCSYIWPVPLDLGEIASVSIGGALVAVPQQGGEFEFVNDHLAETEQTQPAAE